MAHTTLAARRAYEATRKHKRRPEAPLEKLRARMRAAVEKLIAAGQPISRASLRDAGFRGHASAISLLVTELIEDGTVRKEHLHPNRIARLDWQMPVSVQECEADEVRVELPPLRNHAPEMPPSHAKVERPIWSVMRELYWTEGRRQMYRRAM